MKITINHVFFIIMFTFINAGIDWSGNIWPNTETFHVDGSDINIYYQIWKEGVTEMPGESLDISAKLFYKLSNETEYIEVDMSFLGDVGNNDEFSVEISENYFNNNDIIHFYCRGYDSSDSTYSYGTDQNEAGPFNMENPGIYYIGIPTSQDVLVTFNVNMSLETVVNDISVAGNFNNWVSEINYLTDIDNNLIFIGEVLFPVGSNPYQEFKFINGLEWENEINNRSFVIDDTQSIQILDIVYFNNLDPDNFLNQNVEIIFNLDISDSVNSGIMFNSIGIKGNIAPLDWEFESMDNLLTEIENNIWSINLIFFQGESIFLEFKFARNGNDLEAGYEENHQLIIDDSYSSQFVFCEYGNMGLLSIDDIGISPESIMILQNYPNPFNSSTIISISYNSYTSKNIKILIYDINGKILNDYFIIDNQSHILWDAGYHSSGIYFYQLLLENKIIETKKMILIK